MGKKIPFDEAMNVAGTKKNASIFNENNKYGYKININHPDIRPFYEAYHEKIGVPLSIGLSDAQRHHFESLIFTMMERKNNHV